MYIHKKIIYLICSFILSFNLALGQTSTFPEQLESDFRFMGGLMYVKATVNGKTGWFLVDTGSNALLLLNNQYFKGVQSNQKALGMGDGQAISMVKVDSFVWEGLSIVDQQYPAMNLAAMQGDAGEEVLGLIGTALFKNYQLQCNFATRKIRLSKSSVTAADVQGLKPTLTLPFQLINGFPVAQASVQGKNYNWIMDTGATDNILEASLEDSIRSVWKESAQVAMSHAGTAATVRRGTLANLTVGGLRMDGIGMTLAQMPGYDVEKNILGILGFQFFKYFYVDFDYLKGEINCYDMQLVMQHK